MSMHPRALDQRHAQTMASLRQRVGKLETRTSVLDSGFPLALLPGVIDSGYSGTGDPKAYVNGGLALTGPYQHNTNYTPAAGDSVLLAPVPALRTYVIICKYA